MKKYKEFLNEELKELDEKEYDYISEIIKDYLEENRIGGSFDDGYWNHDGDKDLNGLKKHFEEKFGNTLDYFFKKFKDTIYSDGNFIAKNGFYDYMLYTYDSKFMLNGGGIGPEPDDKLMKYFYGFQTTKLGRIFIKQNFNSFAHFYEVCANNFPEYFFENVTEVPFDYGDDEFGVSSTKNYSTCIINISTLDDSYIKTIETDFINVNDDKSSWIIIDDFFIVVFGENVDMNEELERIKIDMERIKIGTEIKKYNII